MAERRRGLGRGIGALIPDNQRESKDRPFDVFFGGPSSGGQSNKTHDAHEGRPALSVSNSSQKNSVPEDSTRGNMESLETEPFADETRSDSAEVGSNRPSTSSQPITPEGESSGGNRGDDRSDQPQDSDPALPLDDEAGFGGTEIYEHEIVAESAAPATVDQNSAIRAVDDDPHGTAAEAGAAGDGAVELRESAMDTAPGDGAVEDGQLVAVPGATYAELPLNSIVPNQRQPRTVFDEDDLEELANSIREVGVLQPVIVRPLNAPVPGHVEARYELIMGERRLRASELAGAQVIPALVRRTADEDLLRDALLENLHRAQLNPLEEAAAYQQLLEDFNCTQEELARRIARSRPQITNTLRLLKLPPLVQRRVAAQVLTAGHARALLGLSDAAAMERLAQRIVAENLSVRRVEELVAMGDEPQATAIPRRRTRRYAPELGDLSGRLTDRFDTRVKVDMGVRKGTIKIDFATIEDLNRILSVMTPELDAVSPSDESEA